MKKLIVSMMVAVLLLVAVPFVSESGEEVAGGDLSFKPHSFSPEM